MKVRLRGAFDQTEGRITGTIDGLVRVRWDDGICGMYWRFQLEPLGRVGGSSA